MGIFVGDMLDIRANTNKSTQIPKSLARLATVTNIKKIGETIDIDKTSIYQYLFIDTNGIKFIAEAIYCDYFNKILTIKQ